MLGAPRSSRGDGRRLGHHGREAGGRDAASALLGEHAADRRDFWWRRPAPSGRPPAQHSIRPMPGDEVAKDHRWREALSSDAGAQIVGGCIGTLVVHGTSELPPIQLAVKARTGPVQWFVNFIAIFGLIVTDPRSVALEERGDPGRGWPLHHGGLLASRRRRPSLNPAVTIAPASTRLPGIAPADAPTPADCRRVRRAPWPGLASCAGFLPSRVLPKV